MFIYELEGEFYNESEHDINYNYEYIMHEKDFSNEEFDKMCQEGLETILDRNIYELRYFLILNYGFKKLRVKCMFGFSESL